MRARNIKPGICNNEILGTGDPMAQLIFAMLPMLADREGKLEDRPMRIKASLFPYRNNKIEPHLDWLEENGFIKRYESSGIKVIYICGFRKHQSPHHTERASELPDKPLIEKASGEPVVTEPLDDGGNPPDSLIHRFTDSLIGQQGKLATTTFTGRDFEIDPRRMADWEKAYPAVAIPVELAKAVAWLQANPANKKSNYDSFLTRWLSKSQDRAPRIQTSPNQYSEATYNSAIKILETDPNHKGALEIKKEYEAKNA